jgi:MYXO-CTERM domain-containing protein
MTRLSHFGFLVGLLAGAAALSSACGDTSHPQEKLGKTTLALDTGVDGGAALALINELKIDPNGSPGDGPQEYVELRGTPGGLLTGFYFVSMEGESGTGAGTADMVVNLSTACGGPCTFGSNGLLVIKAAAGGATMPAETTVVTDTQLDATAGGLENGSNSWLLVFSPTLPIVEGTDYDTGSGLALPAGAIIVDAVGMKEATGDTVYGGVELSPGSQLMGYTRFPTDDTPLSADAWYAGRLTGTPTDVTYSTVSTEVTSNYPAGAALTPGAPNVGTKGTDGGIVPDGGLPDVVLPDVVMMPDTMLPDVASEVAMDAVTPPADTAVTDVKVDAPVDTGAATDTGTAPTDTGIAPTDTGTAPEDTGTGPEDTGLPPLVTDTGTASTDTGSEVAPADTTADEGCSCTTPKSSSSDGAAIAALAVGLVVATRRRRR